MSTAELLDTAFRVVRDNFVVLVGTAAIVYVPLNLIGESLQPTVPGQQNWAAMAATFVILFVIVPIVTTALTHAVGEIYVGRTTSIAGSLRAVLRLIIPLGGTTLLFYLGVMAPLVLLLPAFLILGRGALVALVLLVPTSMYFGLVWVLASTVVVLERRYGTDALGRSRQLMAGNVGRAIVALIIGSLIVFILEVGLKSVTGYIPFLGGIVDGLARAVGATYSTVVLVLLYFDARCRKEAFDLEHLAGLVESGTATT
jgi:hypothetical protein